jgi:3-methyladenine DNA glycosylase/8-oxoguanine DNA glycosylase
VRPVGFHSPYEAACWSVISQRLRILQAAQVRNRIADVYGDRFQVVGVPVHAFPGPDMLRRVAADLPLPEVKQQRLRGIAEAASDGFLDGARLRALSAEEAIAEVTTLPGIGPFSAELVVVRGAGHPDRFPVAEARLHAEMVDRYDLPDDEPATMTAVADTWRPYRSWAAVLLRTAREERTGEIARGRRAS